MSTTRVHVETELVKRQGERMSLVGMAVTIEGSNADLQSPMAQALRKLGYTASNPVTDSDLSVLGSDELDEFYDRAELRLLQNIKGNLTLVDFRYGPRSENLGQIGRELSADIEKLSERIAAEYGSAGGLSAGTISLNFQEKDEDE